MIDLSRFIEMFSIGMLGSASIEAIKAYELRGKLHLTKYQKLIKSIPFWIVTFLFIAIGGIVTWVFNENNNNVTVSQLFVTGMGASSIIRRMSEAIASNNRLVAGEEDEQSFSDMFK